MKGGAEVPFVKHPYKKGQLVVWRDIICSVVTPGTEHNYRVVIEDANGTRHDVSQNQLKPYKDRDIGAQ